WTCHSLGLAVFTKWKVWVCAAPSESYTVSEVVWFQLSGSAASNGATAGTLALAGRLAPTPTLAVARGGASPVASCRSVKRPVSKPVPLALGGNTCNRCPAGLTTKPSSSAPKLPAREYTVAPRSERVKKPSPLIARSSARPEHSTL